ncbi:lytic transglycosylase catalytic [Caballeronia choica]|uniref:Lytic transglycosylase catalytic n=1 Tax=Caballeronia choica TaxID=326476 RepID=A0A158KUZ2_9BURK|nr:lytic transglycosylase domain-containing protein [Caballeronia choica]SAL84914.1 lytic transglycosylase catalytic [Caballeronia choica]
MIRIALVIVAALFGLIATQARADGNFEDLAAQCAPEIHIKTLAAVVRQESVGNPFSININGAKGLPRQPQTAAEAAVRAQALLDRGFNIDVGLGQVNSKNFAMLGVSAAQLFSPCANLQASARILSDCYRRAVAVYGEGQPALHAALSCYNTGSFRNGIANGYVRKVVAKTVLPVPELLPLEGTQATPRASVPTVRSAPPQRAGGEPDVFGSAGDSDAFADKPELKRLH